ncbi:hypothetical protein MNEG_12204 [Monoraphidium neglectum]|uniref:Wax synthase domain-containing protein n=1 Tax=Monoraphidium neglectum TaxID=145388 RepID=A0A0D2J7J0_9CHLO|nr:hypothetical protein MNEG_12204 [Monoraphidium neglectum]KIY95757.1 hypothetical protein MNEG_12204 [Monoraphidium neglectum]|eukprot:XP_013894777.1 hypothetical protein MNEG_12204 [Monoraphidium neglectum]
MLQRTLLFLLPVHPRSPRWGKPPTLGWNLLVLLGKVALQAVVALLLTYVSLHPFLVHSLWAVCIWNLVAMGVDILVPFVQYVMGMPLNPSMNQPYLSVTIQEFWYNLVTTTCLRQSIYEPIIDGSLMRHPPKADGAPSKGGRAAEVVIARQASLATAFALATQHSVVGAAAAAAAAAAASAGLVAGDSASAAGSSGSSSSTASDTETDTDGSSEGDQAARRSGDAAGGGGGAGLRRRKPAALARGDDVAALVGSDQGEAVGSVKVGKLPQLQAPLKLAPPPASGAPAPVPEWRKSLATFMVFFMSGVMHEGLIWYMCHANGYRDTGKYVFGPVMAFFVLQVRGPREGPACRRV